MPDENVPTEPPSIFEIIPKVKASIGSVGKGKRMEEGPAKYAYRSVDDILDAAHQGLVDHGVFWVPWAEDGVWEDFETKKGAKGVRLVQYVRYRVYGPRGDYVEARVPGEAQDYSDKAGNKSMTAAEKILVSQLFAIPYSAQDPDDERPERHARGGEPETPQVPTAEQYAAVMDAAKGLSEEDQAALKEWAHEAGIESFRWGTIDRTQLRILGAYIDGRWGTRSAPDSRPAAKELATPMSPPPPAGPPSSAAPPEPAPLPAPAASGRPARENEPLATPTSMANLRTAMDKLTKPERTVLSGSWKRAGLPSIKAEDAQLTISQHAKAMGLVAELISARSSLSKGLTQEELEKRGLMLARVSDMGPDYEEWFQRSLDGIEGNPHAGMKFGQQLDRLPANWDQALLGIIEQLEQHYNENGSPGEEGPESYEDQDGGPF